METKITHISTTFNIGGWPVTLESDSLDELEDDISNRKGEAENVLDTTKKELTETFNRGVGFRMKKGDRVTLSLNGMKTWLGTIIPGDAGGFDWPDSVKSMLEPTEADNDVPKNVTIELWDFYFNTKGKFEFKIQVAFADSFVTGFGVPDAVAKVFDVKSMGVGVAFNTSGNGD